MRFVSVAAAGGRLSLGERPIPEPGPGEVRVRVRACGICHADAFTVAGGWPGVTYPRVPGHEIAGEVEALGAGAAGCAVGDRVGIGWHGGHDGICESCRRGDFITCGKLRVPGISYDGGYAEYAIVPANVLAPIPDELGFEEAAPLMCAGLTTFNALRHSGARAGDRVAILGLGGLGHLGVQFAAKMGFETIAIARGADKARFAKELGAHAYIDSKAQNAGRELARRSGARVILATVTASDAMEATLAGLGIDGRLIVLGAATDPLPLIPATLLGKRLSIAGWPSGTSADSADTMRFCALTGIRPLIESAPLAEAQAAYDRMFAGAARFRMVLTA
ncbi:MAG: alcohol dehydrogenase catalytic domain-containing protein [Vulcanimicrobiaceae bacterium]